MGFLFAIRGLFSVSCYKKGGGPPSYKVVLKKNSKAYLTMVVNGYNYKDKIHL